MLKKINPAFGWKYLLIMALFSSANISHAITLSNSGDITIGGNDPAIYDAPIFDYNQDISLFTTPITLQSPVIYEDTQVVSGNSKTYTGYFNQRVELRNAGIYEAQLSDFDFPMSFDLLGLTVTSSTEKMGEVWGNGSFDFEADAGTYFLGLIYKTDETLNLGMYGINLRYLGQSSTSAVPLPASLWLMLTGLMTVVSYRRKR